jgi:hypothetical protein
MRYDFHMRFRRPCLVIDPSPGRRSENPSLPLNFSRLTGDLHCLTVGQRECVSISGSYAGSACKPELTHAEIYFSGRTRLEGSVDRGAAAPCGDARRQRGAMADAYPGVQRTNHAVYLLCGARLSANGEAALTAPLSVAVAPRWLKHQTTLANGAISKWRAIQNRMRTHTSLR